MITSTRSGLPSPRWTYGRKSNRTSPRGQRIRAKQPTSRQRIELICEWQHLELPAIAVEDSILVCTENLDANVVMMKSAQDRV